MKELAVLIIGDIIGQPGIRALVSLLPGLKKQYKPDAVLVNAENSADGFGLTEEICQTLFRAGADVLTSGNHVWQQRDSFPFLDSNPNVLRPANYPPGLPGQGFGIYELRGTRFAVLNLQGRTRMWPIDCPFRKAKEILRKNEGRADIFIVDVHAESPDEKEALAWDLDGKVQIVVGTHTHIQTCDERILPKGCAYITDLGATGPRQSIIGFDPETGIQRSLTQLPLKSSVSTNPATLCGVLVKINKEERRSTSIERLKIDSAL